MLVDAKRPHRVPAHDAHSHPQVGQALAGDGVLDRSVAAGCGEDLAELPIEGHLLSEGEHAPFERERAHRDLPAVSGRPDDHVRWGAGAVEEDLVELGGAGDLADGADVDAGLVHRHEQVRQAMMA